MNTRSTTPVPGPVEILGHELLHVAIFRQLDLCFVRLTMKPTVDLKGTEAANDPRAIVEPRREEIEEFHQAQGTASAELSMMPARQSA